MKKYGFILFWISSSLTLLAQEPCKESFYKANKLYEAGLFKESIELLEPCLDQLDSRKLKSLSVHLLAKAYLDLNQTQKSQEYILELLKINPEYQKYPNIDPPQLSKLISAYEVSPKYWVGAFAGLNLSNVSLIKSYSVFESKQFYSVSPGFTFGILNSFPITEKVGLFADLTYSGIGIQHTIENASNWKQLYEEQQNQIGLKTGVEYSLKKNMKLIPYVGLGLGINYLQNTRVTFKTEQIETNQLQIASHQPLDSRNLWQWSGEARAGIRYPVQLGEFSFFAQYSHYLTSTVKDDARYEDLNFIFENQYINDNIQLRSLAACISYRHPILYRVGIK